MGEYSLVACFGKHGYESPKLAQQVAKLRKRKGVRTCYKCLECGKWHLGTSIHNDRKRTNVFKAKKRELAEA